MWESVGGGDVWKGWTRSKSKTMLGFKDDPENCVERGFSRGRRALLLGWTDDIENNIYILENKAHMEPGEMLLIHKEPTVLTDSFDGEIKSYLLLSLRVK